MKNKILRVHVKDKSCNSLQNFRPAALLKSDSKTVFFCQYPKSYSNSFFYGTNQVAAFELF